MDGSPLQISRDSGLDVKVGTRNIEDLETNTVSRDSGLDVKVGMRNIEDPETNAKLCNIYLF
jgi:hypothetical protein